MRKKGRNRQELFYSSYKWCYMPTSNGNVERTPLSDITNETQKAADEAKARFGTFMGDHRTLLNVYDAYK
ncbi:hypothetical protein Hanom_Chr13g01218221 [Helianthus anomalus]